jgi:hypothetical protein
MDSTTKDELKVKINANLLKTPDVNKITITNYDEMLKDLLVSIHKSCEAILTNLENDDGMIAAYNIGLLHSCASYAIDEFGIRHLFDEVEK